MFVDTLGTEYPILGAIDFDNIDISVISVEHNYNREKQDKTSTLLKMYHFEEMLSGLFEFDAIFAKRAHVNNSNLFSGE